MKAVKAWAVVDQKNEFVLSPHGPGIAIYQDAYSASTAARRAKDPAWGGNGKPHRAVPVTITAEEAKE